MKSLRIPALDDIPGYDSWVEVVRTYGKCHQLLTRKLADLSLTTAAHEVLLAVGRREGLTQQALADHLLAAKSNVTGLINRLEQRGLVIRRADERDARSRRLFLTPAGRRLLAQSVECQAEVVRLMTHCLSDEQVAAMAAVMHAAGAQLDAALAGEPAPA